MLKRPRLTIATGITAFLLILLALSACNRPIGSQPRPASTQDLIYTAAVLTIQAQIATFTSSPVVASGATATEVIQTAMPSSTPVIPEATMSGTATALMATSTSSPTLPVEILPSATSLSTSTPVVPTLTATLPSATSTVQPAPSATPQPTATASLPTATLLSGPDYSIEFDNLHKCGRVATAIFKVANSGGRSFESFQLNVYDLTAGGKLLGVVTSDRPFLISNTGCPPGRESLAAGQSAYVAGPLGSRAPSGHTAQVRANLCTNNGLSGACVQKTQEFVVP